MSQVLTYRTSIGKDQLKAIAEKMFHTNLNRFIDEAVKEKIARGAFQSSEAEKWSLEIGKFICEKAGWRIYAPGRKLSKDLDNAYRKYRKNPAKYKRLDI